MRINGFNPTESAFKPFKPTKAAIGGDDGAATEGLLTTFADTLKKSIEDLSSLEKDSSSKTNDLLAGRLDNVHDLMIALEKSKIGLSMAIEVRNKLIEGYKEIMRMQV